MKKIIALFLVLLLTLAVGCNEKKPTPGKKDTTTSSSTVTDSSDETAARRTPYRITAPKHRKYPLPKAGLILKTMYQAAALHPAAIKQQLRLSILPTGLKTG